MEYSHRNIRILVNDHQDITRAGITYILRNERDLEIVPVQDSNRLLELVEIKQADVLITAAESKQTDIAATVGLITQRYPHTGVLVISAFHHDEHIVNMLKAGATGYVVRNSREAEIIEAIRSVAVLKPYYSPEISTRLANILTKEELEKYALVPVVHLTEKEKSFLKLLCYEHSMKDISTMIGLSVRTLEHKKEKLYQKLEKQNIAGLMNYAILAGLYNPYELNR
jgi:DNA-binding NarL/FixJ family response regulator